MTEIVEESVEVIEGFGIQLSSRGRFGKENKTFFNFSAIKDLIINEAVTMQRVIFYLALTVDTEYKEEMKNGHETKDGSTKMVTLFKNTMLRLEELQNIYKEMQPFLNNHNKKEK
ncbi:phosphatidylinositol N-acetylglucosaminyltransferase subunit H-like isoform X2 [Dendronephthya gigantea]|nr:phosphatidylinositol N-acetylglucosaminyltransferase subunit H-like isoform X2 [Dendronephthya gigantea]